MVRILKLVIVGVLAGVTLFVGQSEVVWAQASSSIQCSDDLSYCVMNHRRSTLGDQVIILNEQNQIVAEGRVKAMTAGRRTIAIERLYGPILAGARAQVVEDDQSYPRTIATHYRYYQSKGISRLQASFGLRNTNIGSQSNGFALSGAYLHAVDTRLDLVGRAEFFYAQGFAVDGEVDGLQYNYVAKGLSLLPGVSYELFPYSPLSLRLEPSLGLSYVSVGVNGPAYPQSLTKVHSNQVGLAWQFLTEAQYKGWNSWIPAVGASWAQVHKSRAVTVHVAVQLPLK